ncbi:MAG: disulfide bond formation protein B [Candidatus Symbiobacter sp.]|nr:disulfide bond formation protein B [Candidatus Symbiobacter sp.]
MPPAKKTNFYPQVFYPQAFYSQSAAIILATTILVWAMVLVAQYVFHLPPCPICWYQRWVWLGVGIFALSTLFIPIPMGKKIALALAVLGLVAGGAVAAWHVGIEYRWWAGPADCTGDLATADPAQLLESLASAVTIRCDQAAWTFQGISLAGFNVMTSWVLAVFVTLWWRREKKS